VVAVRFAFLYLISPLVAAAVAPHPAVAPHARCQPIFLSLLVESHLILVCKVPLLSSLDITPHSLYAVIIWHRHLKLLNSCISSPFPLLMLGICFTILFVRWIVFFFDLVNTTIVRLFSSPEQSNLCGSTEDLSTTVKLDNTVEYECRTQIYLAAVPCNGMKKALQLYFAAVTVLIISTGTAQTETLSKWLPHLKKAARQTELHS
jgi:hypothetical protein